MAKRSELNLIGDLAILEKIYKEYEPRYIDGLETADSLHKTYMPIDVLHIAKALGMNEHILWGRLYYHIDQKYRYTNADDSLVHLFCKHVGGENDCIHFPYLAAIVSERQREVRRILVPIVVSAVTAIICSILFPLVMKMLMK